ncbi:MAG: choline-sulfatase, partial [Candidatus Latescibacteria bacterium]|nr:choline-sulfatase [Candidatus Latescibacterota bacterium]
ESDTPWCLYIGPNGPHDPFNIPERFADMYDPDQIALPPSYHDQMEDKPRIYQRHRRQYWDQLSEAEVRESIAHYWGYCTMMDEIFGE